LMVALTWVSRVLRSTQAVRSDINSSADRGAKNEPHYRPKPTLVDTRPAARLLQTAGWLVEQHGG
ncbi:MAG: hypothetical protein KKD27_19215, partial [Gammaproteobacteria bacterium]|nr:hypothetical protein [Gammaproteobacteria bacterium]